MHGLLVNLGSLRYDASLTCIQSRFFPQQRGEYSGGAPHLLRLLRDFADGALDYALHRLRARASPLDLEPLSSAVASSV